MTGAGPVGPPPSVIGVETRIAAVLSDPAVRDWVKEGLRHADDRDPVDAARDAQLLAELLGARVDALLSGYAID